MVGTLPRAVKDIWLHLAPRWLRTVSLICRAVPGGLHRAYDDRRERSQSDASGLRRCGKDQPLAILALGSIRHTSAGQSGRYGAGRTGEVIAGTHRRYFVHVECELAVRILGEPDSPVRQGQFDGQSYSVRAGIRIQRNKHYSHPGRVQALGVVSYDVLKDATNGDINQDELEDQLRVRLEPFRHVDWDRSADIWEGNLVSDGRIRTQTPAIKAAAGKLLAFLAKE